MSIYFNLSIISNHCIRTIKSRLKSFNMSTIDINFYRTSNTRMNHINLATCSICFFLNRIKIIDSTSVYIHSGFLLITSILSMTDVQLCIRAIDIVYRFFTITIRPSTNVPSISLRGIYMINV